MTQEMKYQLETAATTLRIAREKVADATDSVSFAKRQLIKATEAEQEASTRYFTYVNQLLEQPAD